MPFQVYVFAACIVASIPLVGLAVGGDRRSGLSVHSRLGFERVPDVRTSDLQRPLGDRLLSPAVDALARRARRITPVGVADSLARRARLAGVDLDWPVERLLGAKLGLALFGLLIGGLRLAGDASGTTLLWAAALTAGGWFAPDAVLSQRAARRAEQVRRALPDTVDQITVCVEAGLGFSAALNRVAAASDGVLASEFRRAMQDVRVGRNRAEALQGVVDRTGNDDLRRLVLAITQADRYGLPLGQVLRLQAKDLRQRRAIDAEERAMKVPVKLTMPVVLCIFPVLLIVLGGPAVIRLSDMTFG